MKVCKPPTPIDYKNMPRPRIFLGGAIDMGEAEDWQTWLTKELKDVEGTVVNPRRDDWDSSWKQDPTPGTKFYEQVSWEMLNQEKADIIVYYFSEDSKAPITLLELGTYGGDPGKRVIVFCPKKFYRHGNVAMFCDRHGIDLFEDKESFLEEVKGVVHHVTQVLDN